MDIRTVEAKDAADCVRLYNHYIENTTVTFEETPLSEAQFAARVFGISERFPYLVAVENGRVLGYAYLSPFGERSAYRFTVDLSIYVDKDARQNGIGSALLNAVETEAKKRGFRNLVSVITGENAASVAFHEKHGFRLVGRLPAVGFKMGRWLDVMYYQKTL